MQIAGQQVRKKSHPPYESRGTLAVPVALFVDFARVRAVAKALIIDARQLLGFLVASHFVSFSLISLPVSCFTVCELLEFENVGMMPLRWSRLG